jgi:glycosyltransferase involved in cell wall biosynthesis
MPTDAISEKSPLFSIITVCLNEPNLERTCESIVDQTFQDFEWIVIDGGSNEETLAIFEKYQQRMDYFVSEKDKGIYDAMNKGIAKAKGEWLNFMNAGDMFADNLVLLKIRHFMPNYNEIPNIIYGDIIVRNNIHTRIIKYPSKMSKEFLFHRPTCHQACFLKRDIVVSMGCYNLKYRLAADFELCLRLFLHSPEKVMKIEIPVVDYDQNGLSAANPKDIYKEISEIKCLYYTNDEIKQYNMSRAKKVRSLYEKRHAKTQ